MKNLKKVITPQKIIIVIIIITATLLSSSFIFQKGILKGVDTQYHLSRIKGIAESWKAGNIPAYIHLDDAGYGYAMGFFYSNIFMILPSILYILGMDIIVAYKIFIIICGLFTAISMYICVKEITKNKYAATIAMFIYTTCSYRIITMIAKAFIGELLSFIFIPLIFLGIYKIIYENEKKWWIFSIGFIGILNSNLVMTEIMICVSLFIIILNIKTILKNKEKILGLIKATILALLLSTNFWMPMLEQLNKSKFNMFTIMEYYKPSKWLIEFKDIFLGTVQYKNNLAAAYGLGLIFVIILPFRIKIKENNPKIKFGDIILLIGLILLIMLTNYFPWEKLNKIGETIQFPSRFEVVISAIFAIECGIILSYIKKEKTKKIIFGLIFVWQVVSIILCYNSCIETIQKYIGVKDINIIKVKKDFCYNICDGVYLPEGANNYDFETNNKNKEKKEDLKTNNEQLKHEGQKEKNKMKIKFSNNNLKDTYIDIPINYYYGYEGISEKDKSEYKLEKSPEGLIRIYLAERKEDEIIVQYKKTKIQKNSLIISTISFIATIIYISYKKIEKEKYKKEEKY